MVRVEIVTAATVEILILWRSVGYVGVGRTCCLVYGFVGLVVVHCQFAAWRIVGGLGTLVVVLK